jgi:integral membrane sensor domain MASE1
MNDFLHVILAIGGIVAAAAVAVMCVVCLFVWLGGSMEKEPSEAWRHADKS